MYAYAVRLTEALETILTFGAGTISTAWPLAPVSEILTGVSVPRVVAAIHVVPLSYETKIVIVVVALAYTPIVRRFISPSIGDCGTFGRPKPTVWIFPPAPTAVAGGQSCLITASVPY